jgi:hypothetical protein
VQQAADLRELLVSSHLEHDKDRGQPSHERRSNGP